MAVSDSTYIIFESIGEVSKDIMATAVVSAVKAEYSDSRIVVVTLHPEVWLHNPDVYRIYRMDMLSYAYFYEDYVKNRVPKIFKMDPYHSVEFLSGNTHLIDAWCRLCGVRRNGAMPKLFFTQREIEVTGKILGTDKPIFFLQPHGETGGMPYPLPWSRDLHPGVASEIAGVMLARGYKVIDVTKTKMSNRLLMCAVRYSAKSLFVDSFFQHAAAAYNKPAAVVWNTFTPQQHGYAIHKNIMPQETDEFIEARNTYIDQFRIAKIPPHKKSSFSPASFMLHDSATILKNLESL